MSDTRLGRSGSRAARSSTTSANNRRGLASMREVSSMAFSQLLAADGLTRSRGLPVGLSMTPAFMAEYLLIEHHVERRQPDQVLISRVKLTAGNSRPGGSVFLPRRTEAHHNLPYRQRSENCHPWLERRQ